jgi:hypothetical protein
VDVVAFANFYEEDTDLLVVNVEDESIPTTAL